MSGSLDNTIKQWDIYTGELIKTFKGHTSYIYSLAITPNGKYLLSGSGDYTIKQWDIYTGKLVRTLKGHTSTIHSISVSPNGKYILSGSGSLFGHDKIIKQWDIHTGKLIRTIKKTTNKTKSSPLPSRDWLLLLDEDNKTVKQWGFSLKYCASL
jgi:WD40 repeat protein